MAAFIKYTFYIDKYIGADILYSEEILKVLFKKIKILC